MATLTAAPIAEEPVTTSRPNAPTRQGIPPLSRRASLSGLGGGLAATLLSTVAVSAGNGKKKRSKRERKRCRRQEGQCRAYVAAFCADADVDPEECEDRLGDCCPPFERCDAGDAYICLLRAFGAPV
jgi:hypothetical protein